MTNGEIISLCSVGIAFGFGMWNIVRTANEKTKSLEDRTRAQIRELELSIKEIKGEIAAMPSYDALDKKLGELEGRIEKRLDRLDNSISGRIRELVSLVTQNNK
jgi:wobble nucleotide-excising tRNase